MRVIFLDFDGVLNSLAHFENLERLGVPQHDRIHHLDPLAIERLNKIVEVTGALVVVSSTWRLIGPTSDGRKGYDTIERLEETLKEFGYRHSVFGLTPADRGCNWHDDKCDKAHRGGEINQWLVEHPYFNVTKFVIVDDSSDMYPHMDRLVHTTWQDGLQDEHVEKIINMFKRDVGSTIR